jgi:2',3'-cyclic-nucleotide 2'-phosphodiesterase (5'-nucleotidase family)
MKKILIIALTLIAFTAAKAQSPVTSETAKATISTIVSAHTDLQTPAAVVPATTAPTAGNAPDNSAKYVGTNDLNLFLLRDGIKKA